MFPDPEEKALWSAAATTELSAHVEQQDLTDKQRKELIALNNYRNDRKSKTGKI